MSRYNEAEYLDALVSLELAAKLAEKDGRKVNAAIKACWKAARPRISNNLNRSIFDGVARQVMPYGALCMLRRQLDSMLGDGK